MGDWYATLMYLSRLASFFASCVVCLKQEDKGKEKVYARGLSRGHKGVSRAWQSTELAAATRSN